MAAKTAEVYDYQARAREFAVGDWVIPLHFDALSVGRIVQLFPGIGMAQVEFSFGNKRFPVEDLTKVKKENSLVIPPMTDSTPGGSNLVDVSAGPPARETPTSGYSTKLPTMSEILAKRGSAKLVADAFMKQSLYWHKADRNYRVTKQENVVGSYSCPRKRCGSSLQSKVYKMREGRKERLLVCPNCNFLIKEVNVHKDHHAPRIDPGVDLQKLAESLVG